MRSFWASTLLVLGGCNCEGEGGLSTLAPQIVAEPNPMPWGNAFVGIAGVRRLVVKNAGSADLVVGQVAMEAGSHPGFNVPPDAFTLAPAAERELLVSLEANAEGPITGAILLDSNDPSTPRLRVPITATGARRDGPALVVCVQSAALGLAETCELPLRVDFGAVPVGASVEAALTLRSAGQLAVNIISAEPQPGADPAFSFNPATLAETLAPNQERSISVTLRPTVEGAIGAVFQVVSNDPERDLVPVILTANGVPAGLCANPSLVDFGITAVGTPVTRSVTLSNCGQVPLTLNQVSIENAHPEFSASLVAPVALAPGATHPIEVTYLPTDTGVDMGRLSATADIGEIFVTLRGQTNVCSLVVNPLALHFGSVGIGQTQNRVTLIENVGGAECTVSALTVMGNEFSVATAAGVVPPGGSLPVSVEYAPTNAGTDMGTLTVVSNDPDDPNIVVTLEGRRLEAGECQLTAMPDPVNFGVVPLGTRRTQQVTVTNSGTSLCTITGVQIGAGSSASFGASGGPAIPVVLSGRSFTVDVTYQPLSASSESGTLEINTLRGPTTVALNGSGSGPKLCITPDPVILGSHPQGIAVTRSATLVSCGSENLVLSGLNLAPPTSTEFSLVTPLSLPLTLPAGSSQLVDIRYLGANPGRDDGILRAVSNDVLEPSQDVQLIAATGQTCGDVVGRICGLDGMGPVPGATVYVNTPGGRIQTTTNAQGDFVLTCLPVGAVTITAESGSWSTSFTAQVMDQQITTIPGQQCLNPNSAEVAVVWGEWDQIEGILQRVGVPYTFYDQNQQEDLLLDPAELARYDIVFLNCGFNDLLARSGAGATNLRNFVANGGAVYASDWAYDALEANWPMFVDYYGDDAVFEAAQSAGNFSGLVDVVEPSLRSALGGRMQVNISSCCTGIEAGGPGTTVYLEGDRYNNNGRHPFFVSFVPSAGAGTVMYTDFHNTGQPDIEAIFRWLINRL